LVHALDLRLEPHVVVRPVARRPLPLGVVARVTP
jgi:hypothetical protein